MASSTTKKALIRRYDRETLAGYVNPLSFLQPEGVELLSDQANVTIVPYLGNPLAWPSSGNSRPALLQNVRFFRPVRKLPDSGSAFAFAMERSWKGLLPNNLLHLESAGFTVIPPESFGNLQRVWVPRASLISVEVLGVVGSPLRKRKPKESKEQIGLFEE